MNKLKTLGIIPVRLESSRLPNKPLKDIFGKSLVQRVWEQAKKCQALSELVIATNSDEIKNHCTSFGASVVMTSSKHETGTDRVAEAAQIVESQGTPFQIVANIQGDLPFINPQIIDSTIENLINAASTFGMATIGTPITDREEFERPASVKIAIGENQLALYFSRSPIPYWRNFPDDQKINEANPYGYKHMGLYVFKREVLNQLSTLKSSFTEQRERLEQLRALSNGIKISVNIIPRKLVEPSIEVDTPEDLLKAVMYAQSIQDTLKL